MLGGKRFAAWTDRPVKSITEDDIQTVVDLLTEGHETAANRYLDYLRMLFGWARKRKLIEVDPTADVGKPGAEASRERVLGLDELRAIWAATAATQTNKGDLFASIVKVLALTGQRRNEVAGMRWSESDRPGALWSLPGERCKNGRPHLVPLSAPRVALLEERKAEQKAMGLKDEDGNPTPLVFTSNGETPFSGWSRSKQRLDAHAGLAQPWTLHDLRRTLVTRMSEDLRIQPHVVEAVVNHVSGTRAGVAGIYIGRCISTSDARPWMPGGGTFYGSPVLPSPTTSSSCTRAEPIPQTHQRPQCPTRTSTRQEARALLDATTTTTSTDAAPIERLLTHIGELPHRPVAVPARGCNTRVLR